MDTKRIVVPEAEEILGLYFPALDHGFVALLDYMGGDIAIERAARCSYRVGPEERTPKEREHLIRYMSRHHHGTPFEQTEITVHIGLPIFVMRQLVRTRTAHLNEYSGRYSPMPMLFYEPSPDQVCYQSTSNKQGRSGPVDDDTLLEFYDGVRDVRGRAEDAYVASLRSGVAKETARIDLPLSTYTYIYWKIDIRNLFHFIGLRSDSHAQYEMRVYSDILAGIAQRLCPLAFASFCDYQLEGVSFSMAEMRGIRALSHFHISPIMWDSPPEAVKALVSEVLAEWGVVGREAAEFWDKLRLRSKRDFNLDPASAKPASYFQQMVADHSHEVG